MNSVKRWLLRQLLKQINQILISKTVDTKEPVITFINDGQSFASMWLKELEIDDTCTIRVVTAY